MKKKADIIGYLKNIDLYKKERLVIVIMLLGFAVSGITLPIVKAQMHQDNIYTAYQTSDGVNNTEHDESDSDLEDTDDTVNDGNGSGLEDSNDIEINKSDSGLEEEKDTEDNGKTENNNSNTNNKDTVSSPGTSKPTTSTPASTPGTLKPTTSTPAASSPTTSTPGTSTPATSKPTTSSPSVSTPTPTPSTQKPSVTPSVSPEPTKIWVAPVYKTVHHDAVYETKKVYICNFCSAAFNSAGEFQVHKDENGGWGGEHKTCRVASQKVLVKEAWDEQVLVSEGYYK